MCQHGPQECKGNIQQSCIVGHPVDHDTHETMDQETQIRVINCIENSGDVTSEQTVRDVS